MPSPRKKYKVRTGLRAASRSQEAELLSRAKKLRNSPEMVLPACRGECRRCPFERIRRNLKAISTHHDDPKKLMAFASRGDDIEKAYAATLLIAHEGKAPRLAPFTTPYGTTTWIKRGKAKREQLVGVQHNDDPYWRLFTVIDTVRKNGIFVYSTRDGMVCTGDHPEPPEDFVRESLRNLKYSLKRDGDLLHCPHLTPEAVRKPRGWTFLSLEWVSAGVRVTVCPRCARKVKTNTMAQLASRVAGRDVASDFTVKVVRRPRCKADCEGCVLRRPPPVPDDLLDEYGKGDISDHDLMEKYRDFLEEEVVESGETLYLHGDVCYGRKRRSFVRSLEPASEDEEVAITAILRRRKGPVLVERTTAGRFLAANWKGNSLSALVAVTGDKEMALRVKRSDKASGMTPSQLIREAAVESRRVRIISQLPAYGDLPEVARFADQVARLYRSHGSDDAVRFVDHHKGSHAHSKAAAYAVLLALGQGEGKKWQFTQTEQDFARFLTPYIRALLEAGPEDYNQALQNVLSATGSVKTIEPLAPEGAGGDSRRKKKKRGGKR